jgi:RimJ/RimL family protein N-acetyltransferase
MLQPGEEEAYLRHMVRADADSGEQGVFFHPYPSDEPFDLEAALVREQRRWQTPLHTPGWRRAWGWRAAGASGALVGHAYLAGGQLRSELHRVSLGMGLQHAHRGQGAGRRLLGAVIAWARDQPGIAWIDLGVFGCNPRAQALYRSHGFVETGRTPDRFRVDGVSIDDISMSLSVG